VWNDDSLIARLINVRSLLNLSVCRLFAFRFSALSPRCQFTLSSRFGAAGILLGVCRIIFCGVLDFGVDLGVLGVSVGAPSVDALRLYDGGSLLRAAA
jgi:hypothetical protein